MKINKIKNRIFALILCITVCMSLVPQYVRADDSVSDTVMIEETSAAQEQSGITDDTVSTEDTQIAEEPTVAEEPAQVEETSAAEETTAAEEPTTAEETTAVEEPAPAEEPTAAEVTAAAETDNTSQQAVQPQTGVVETPAVSGVAKVLTKTVRTSDNYRYKVTVAYDANAGIPADAELKVKEITSADQDVNEEDIKEYIDKSAEALDINLDEMSSVRLFDISLVGTDGTEYQPNEKVGVAIELLGKDNETEDMRVVHFAEDDKLEELKTEVEDNVVSFETEGFSLFSLVDVTVLQKDIDAVLQSADGTLYENDDIILTGKMPAHGIVEANPVSVNIDGAEVLIAYDIKIYANPIFKALGITWQPTEGSIKVTVKSDALAGKNNNLSIYHIKDNNSEAEYVSEVTPENSSVTFDAEGFSAYAIVQGPGAVPGGWTRISTIDELKSMGSSGLYVGHVDGYYFKSDIYYPKPDQPRTGITKTKPAQAYPADAAVKYYFEFVDGTNNFKAYCMEGENRKYVIQPANDSLNFTTEADEATVFTLEQFGNTAATFRVKGNNNYYWNMQGSANGNGFAAYTGANDVNAKLFFWYYIEVDEDPYKLDGKTYGLMNWNESITGRALMATSSAAGMLDALPLTVLSKKDDNADKLFVPDDSEITKWTFHYVEDDLYTLSAETDEGLKYLSITSTGISLVSEMNDTCKIRVLPGSGGHANQICLQTKNGSRSLTYSGSVATGFSVGGLAGTEWLYLVDDSELTNDYLKTYTASKVGVSDDSVVNGSRIIVYTRTWNDTTKKYEFYAVDHDGSLVRCFEAGDNIEWLGSMLNTLLWNFVEYYWEGTSDPNYYYELYNQYSEKYIAPQVTGGQILQDTTIGINLNGRRDGYYQSTILAWDDSSYAFVGLKADIPSGKIVSCPMAKAEDFYFAILSDIPVDDTLSTVQTIDHTQYGITMRIVDLENSEKDRQMDNFLHDPQHWYQGIPATKNLLTNYLGANGYPNVTTGNNSLANLFSGAQEVNHIFIGSTYSGSGYYEFDSSQNFAHLNANGNFTVYNEIASYDTTDRPTLKHGQFYPFNDIKPGYFASVNGKNLYSTTGEELSENDPRKYERLYLLQPRAGEKTVDNYFGVELEATFTQTANGLDDWGHDIIYEFTGDDDFWLYVDGELIIDLGGVHSALPGSVNYSTGDVYVEGVHYTLRELFESNYRSRTPGATDAQVAKFLAQYFDEGSTIFKDFSTHTMRIFYMERGAGASNIHMRFNLASVKPGTVELTKELEGIDKTVSVLAEFPYQIWYKLKDEEGHVTEHMLVPNTSEGVFVRYKDTVKDVTFKSNFTIPNTSITYENVFMVKPGQTIVITLPADTVSYKVIECGVNTAVYNKVTVNGTEISGAAVSSNRKDFAIGYDSSDERPTVKYVNSVDSAALRTLRIKKKLYKEDGGTELHYDEDNSTFSFRLYLGTEFDTDLEYANMYTYHVRDESGNYCQWNAGEQRFVPVKGATDYSEFDADMKSSVTFNTSIFGSISKIPAGYTVEVPNILAGTSFRVQERPAEIPDGYSFQKYEFRDLEYTDANAGVKSIAIANEDPKVVVCNIRGYGVRVNKVWSDADYMTDREATYFAVFTADDQGNPIEVIPATADMRDENGDRVYPVRQLKLKDAQNKLIEQTLYWYFPLLPVATATALNNYVIKEVIVENPGLDAKGNVTSYTSVTPLADGDTITLDGVQRGGSETAKFTYTVVYEQGTVAPGSQVRVDKVGNNRPGVLLKKTDWNGTPLAGAIFELRNGSGELIGTFTSDDEGIITTAFLSNEDERYTLTETKAPQGYQGLPASIVISHVISQNGSTVTVSGVDSDFYDVLRSGVGIDTSLTIKNRSYTFTVVKKDADTDSPLANVHFELHRQVTVGDVTIIDPNPMTGYEDLITDVNGVVPKINENTLPAGTYQLREKEALDGYHQLSGYITFTISPTGFITLGTHPDEATLDSTVDSGVEAYVLTINNNPMIVAPSGVTSTTAPFMWMLFFGGLLAGIFAITWLRWKGGKRDE